MNECIINNKYRITEKLGRGAFGNVYKGINQKNNQQVAIKIEGFDSIARLLKHETTILNYLFNEGLRNIPTVYWYGTYGENICTVMSLYDKSLFDITQGQNLSYKNKICEIILQCVCIIENIHQKFVIHRDVKPQNIMFKDGLLYFIDFGLSTFYLNEKRVHILDEKRDDNLIGSPKWMSYYLHIGHQATRRDDLISLGYVFMYLLSDDGKLPWDEDLLQGTREEKNKTRSKKKDLGYLLSVTKNDILQNYFKLCYGLEFTEEPPYYALKDILRNDIKE
jgi:serine/threonine protein kinase